MMKSKSSQLCTEGLAWVFSDKAGLRQRLLQEYGLKTMHFHHDLHSRSQCQDILSQLEHQGPLLLWIRFAGPCAGSGNKHDALRAEHLFRLVRQQCQKGLPVVIEASERSQVWNLQVVKQCAPLLHATLHQWCNYEQLRHGHDLPCCSKLKLLSNFPVPNGDMCTCGDVQHVHAKELGSQNAIRFEQVLRQLMHVVCKQKISNLKMPCVQMPANEQPESLPSDLNLSSEGLVKSVRFSSMYQCEDPNLVSSKRTTSTSAEQHQQHKTFSSTTKPDSLRQLDSREDFWLFSGSNTVIRVHVEPRNQLYVPQSNGCPVSLTELEKCRQTRMQSQGLSMSQPLVIDDEWQGSTPNAMPFHWVGTTTFKLKPSCNGLKQLPQQSMFPTEEAIRQKQKKASGHVAKPRPKKVEQHCDDCGDNLDCLDVFAKPPMTDGETEAFSCEQQLMDHVCQMFFNPRIQCFGCDADEPQMFWTDGSRMPSIAEVFHARANIDDVGIDCMEMFGGQGTTTYILSKFHGLQTGINFEMLCGVDLSKQADVQYLFAYIRRNKPKVILLAPPCRGYSKWGHLNRKINHEAWVESRQLSVPLARLSGDVAIEQYNNGRHFFVEQPQGSGLYEEPPWLKLKDYMFSIVFDQCMTGLCMLKPPYLPVRKPTECKASHPALLMFLQNLRCDGSHEHAHIGSWGSSSRHTVKSADMQVWPKRTL